ncbi:MAG: FAD-dependent oxidoreductase [bacterium]
MVTEYSVELESVQTPKNKEHFDVLVIGSGPAGMSAALCSRRAGLKVLIIDKALPGGQTSTAYNINNYLGFPNGILGVDLSGKMELQLKQQGVFFLCDQVIDVLTCSEKAKQVKTVLGHVYFTKSIVLATGLEPKPLDKSFEKRFLGRGVSYYAQGDGLSYQGKSVAVIGGGNCACYAADYLLNFVERLYLIHRGNDIKAVRVLKDKVLKHQNLVVLWETDVLGVFGVDKVEKLKCQHLYTGQETWLDVQCVFIYVGRVPSSEFFLLDLQTDEGGYVLTDDYMRTSIPGIYAVGDIRHKQIRQIATAVSDGMIAAINIERDLFR